MLHRSIGLLASSLSPTNTLFIFQYICTVMVASSVALITLASCCVVLLLCANLIIGCDAWATTTNNNPRSRVTAPAASSIVSATTNELSIQQRQKLLQSALTQARKTDQKYGLVAPESIYAWSIVDELYAAIPEYSSVVEDNVRKVLGAKQKSVWDL
jgi:hypothetical protein